MRIIVVRAAGHRAMPWRNGLGTTREIAVRPEAAPDRFAWRASIATVDQACAFSAFPGYDRIITVIDGNGMTLRIDGAEHRLDRRYVPFAFRGEAAVTCTPLDGAIHDLNIMVDRSRHEASVVPLSVGGDGEVRNTRAVAILVVCLGGSVHVRIGPDAPAVALGRWDTAIGESRTQRPTACPVEIGAITGRSVVALVTIGPAAAERR
ncbi:MAG: HutD family protein [Alphaproteobacteria bacterium]